jgi:hypothetical protein
MPGYSVPILGTIDTTDPRDTYATHSSNLGLGGIHHVSSIAERDAITVDRRIAGMLCTVQEDGGFYQLASDLSTWLLLNIQSQANPNQESFICETNIIGHRAVMVSDNGMLVYATTDNLSVINRYIGITTQSANALDFVNVTVNGKITEPSWNWIVGSPIFLGLNGVLTQSITVIGVSWILAIPTSPTVIFIVKRSPIILI